MKILLIAAACAAFLIGPRCGASAQSNFTPPNLGPAYGYQPYNDRNPTGFNHPNNMGYGHYVYSPKATGRRAGSMSYRRFRGY